MNTNISTKHISKFIKCNSIDMKEYPKKKYKSFNDFFSRKIDLTKRPFSKLNNDFIGWLKINNTNISYPVMQTDCNRKDYYLRKNFYKEYSQLGTPYIAEYCNVQTGDNVIVYGHHITDHQVFGELEKYKKKAFYDNHKVINFNTIYGNADYEIIYTIKK